MIPTASLLFTVVVSLFLGVHMFRLQKVARFLPTESSRTMRMMSQNTGVVLNMRAVELKTILNDPDRRGQFQVVDVRESDELKTVSLPDKQVIHMALSQSGVWAEKVITGDLLDKTKPTICICHHGMRSKRLADFLGKKKRVYFLCIFDLILIKFIYVFISK